MAGEADRQLPLGDEIFLDHVGHFVRNPNAAARALERFGFAPTPISVQRNPDGTPTGTGNVCAMFARGYVECLFKTADTPLGAEFDAAMARYGGIHLAAFAVTDAATEHRRLATAGFPMRPLVQFQRPVDTEGGAATAAFTVVRVERGAMAEGRIQMLTHRTEAAVWQPRWLTHPNGARGLTSVTIVVDDLDEAAVRFVRFTGHDAVRIPSGQTIRLDRGRIELVARCAFESAFAGVAMPGLPFIGAYGVVVESLDRLETILQRASVGARRIDASLIVPFPEELGQGAWIFTENAAPSPFR